jgi:integrase
MERSRRPQSSARRENTVRLALHGLGFKVTAHGSRSLLTDLLNEQGFNPDWIERQLDHVQKDKVRAAYLHTDFFEGRSTMMEWLAAWAEAQHARRRAEAAGLRKAVAVRGVLRL